MNLDNGGSQYVSGVVKANRGGRAQGVGPVFLGLDFAEYDRLLARDAAELIRAESDADGDPPRRNAA